MAVDQRTCSHDELAAVRGRFAAVVARWTLAEAEVRALLGSDAWPQGAVTADAETRLRLLIDVDALLGLVLAEDALADWLRAPNPAFVDRLTPLVAMSGGVHAIRGIRNVLQDLEAAR